MGKLKSLFDGKKGMVMAVVVGLFFAGVGSAAVLDAFGNLEGQSQVAQSVLVNGKNYSEVTSYSDELGDSAAVAGNTYESIHTLTTESEAAVPLGFSTSQCLASEDNCSSGIKGIDTSYQLVTTAFAKGNYSTKWIDTDNDGEKDAVRLIGVGEGTEDPAVVMVPLYEKDVKDVLARDHSINQTESSAYVQFMIDVDPANADSNWAQVYGDNSGNYALHIYEKEGDFVNSWNGLWPGDVADKVGKNARVVAVKAQIWNDGNNTTVKSITLGDQKFELNKNDRHSVDVATLTNSSFTMPPLPGEEFDFRITNEFDVALEPAGYKIETEVVPQ